jgi:4-hydroxy-tetrahydrodipicolinate synthase
MVDAIDAPVIVYNVPGRTASNIEAATALRIAELPNIAGIKEASGNIGQVMEILRNRPAGFAVWSGDDAVTLPFVALGADGVVSVVSNEVPREFSKMVRSCLAGDFAAARNVHELLLPLMNINFIESIQEEYRLPVVPLQESNRPKLKAVLHDLGLVK